MGFIQRLIFFWAIIFIIVMNVSFVSSFYEVNKQLRLTESCAGYNCTGINITILYPNSSILVNNQQTTANGYYVSFNFTPTTYGDYIYYISDGGNTSQQKTISVNYSGKEVTSPQAIIYAALIFLLVCFFALLWYGVDELPSGNTRDSQGLLISISWLKYARSTLLFLQWLVLVSIFYLSSNLAYTYLGEQLFAKILFVFFRLSLALTLPIVVIWFIWVFINAFQDIKLKKQMEQGFFGSKF